MRVSLGHVARRNLFRRGIRRGSLTVREIEGALLPGCLDDAERWLLYYSLWASRVSILGDDGIALRAPDGPPPPG